MTASVYICLHGGVPTNADIQRRSEVWSTRLPGELADIAEQRRVALGLSVSEYLKMLISADNKVVSGR